jgi:hypothetical protein
MKHLVSRPGIIVAGSAATMSVVWAFGPHVSALLSVAMSLAWASLACVAVVWVVKGSVRLNRRLGDVIGGVEAMARIPAASVSDRALGRQVGTAGWRL